MRKEKEVRQRLESLCVDRLKKRKESFLSVHSRNCEFNARARVSGRGMTGFCRNKKLCAKVESGVLACDSEERAKKCSLFKCKNTHASVEDDFHDILRSPARCGNEYPKVAMLIWFLQDFPQQSRIRRMSRSWREVWGAMGRLMFMRWW